MEITQSLDTTIFMITGVLLIHDVNTNYDDVSMSTSDFDSNFNMTDEMYNLTEEIKDAAGVKDIEEDDTPNSLFSGAYAALTLLLDSYRLIGNVMDSIMRVIPIPSVFKTVGIIVITLFITFQMEQQIHSVMRHMESWSMVIQ